MKPEPRIAKALAKLEGMPTNDPRIRDKTIQEIAVLALERLDSLAPPSQGKVERARELQSIESDLRREAGNLSPSGFVHPAPFMRIIADRIAAITQALTESSGQGTDGACCEAMREAILSIIPGGDICDPQQIADAIRALPLPVSALCECEMCRSNRASTPAQSGLVEAGWKLTPVAKGELVDGETYIVATKHGFIEGDWDAKAETFGKYFWRDMEFWGDAFKMSPLSHAPSEPDRGSERAMVQARGLIEKHMKDFDCFIKCPDVLKQNVADALLSHAPSQPAPVVASGWLNEAHQHVGWLKQYTEGMSPENWRDMRDRAMQQLSELSKLLRASPQPDRESERTIDDAMVQRARRAMNGRNEYPSKDDMRSAIEAALTSSTRPQATEGE